MRIHLLAIPHTVTRPDFSHCAFTGKVERFSPMMRAQGFEASPTTASPVWNQEDVVLMEQDEHLHLLGQKRYDDDPTASWCESRRRIAASLPQFNYRLRDELIDRGSRRGHHLPAVRRRARERDPGAGRAEERRGGHGRNRHRLSQSGHDPPRVRVAGVATPTMGKEEREGWGWESPRQEWVIPNYYVLRDWPVVTREELTEEDKRTVVFLGRISESKGVAVLPRLARAHPHLRFVMCGQGDLGTPYLTEPNLEYKAPIHGTERAHFLGHAAVALFPSRMVEPFCGSAVESMLCFPAETRVRAEDVIRTHKRVHTGVLLQLDTHIDSIRCTPEHHFSRSEAGSPLGI